MLTQEQNEQLTRTDRGTLMGDLLRRYWIPALHSWEIAEPDCAPVRVQIMGEKLVAFRDSEGRIGVIDEFCAHRSVSLWFGRNEECGLRCPYHGWKYDVNGQCVDLPSEPEESGMRKGIKLKSYPAIERGDVVWIYMGPPELKPAPPELEWVTVSPERRFLSKRLQETNYLQVFEVVDFEGGLLIGARRKADHGKFYWRITPWVMPWFTIIPPRAGHPLGAHAWVPIDDEHCWAWSINYHPNRRLSAAEVKAMKEGAGIHVKYVPGTFVPLANKSNDYLIDRSSQKRGRSYSGVEGIAMQDASLQESMGAIQDRTREHLCMTDKGIVGTRSRLLRAAKAAREGKSVQGLDPASQRVRSCAIELPVGQHYKEGAKHGLFPALDTDPVTV